MNLDTIKTALASVFGVSSESIQFVTPLESIESDLVIPDAGFSLSGGISNFLDAIGLDNEHLMLPDQFISIAEGIKVTKLGLNLADISNSPINFKLEIPEKKIDILDFPKVSFENPSIEVYYSNDSYQDAFGNTISGIKVTIAALFEICPGTKIGVALAIPQMEIFGGLAPESELDLEAFFKHYEINIPGLEKFDIGFLFMKVRFTPPFHLAFSIEVKSQWEVIPGKLSISKLRFDFEKSGTAPSEISGSVSGIIAIEEAAVGGRDLEIQLEAIYDGSGTWRFSGSTGQDQKIPVGVVIDKLVKKLGTGDQTLPKPIQSLTMEDLRVSFDTLGNFEFTISTSIEIEKRELSLDILLRKTTQQAGTTSGWELVGSLYLDIGIELNVGFSNKKSDKYIVGALSIPQKIWTKSLIKRLAPDIADVIPLNVGIEMKGLLIAVHFPTTTKSGQSSSPGKAFLFRVLFNLDVNLKGFPLIGTMLKDIKFINGQLLAANNDWKDEQIGEVNGLLEEFKPKQPRPLTILESSTTKPTVNKGISLGGTFQITEDLKFPLFLNFGSSSNVSEESRNGQPQAVKGDKEESRNGQPQAVKGDKEESGSKPTPSTPDTRSQSKVNQVLGAVSIKKVSLIFEGGKLGLKLTGGLALAAFQFDLLGLQVTVPQAVLSDPSKIKEIEFGLDGFTANIQKGTLLIAGAFLRKHYPAKTEHGRTIPAYDEFNGAVTVSYPPFSLAGLGSYAKYDGQPSLFMFVALGVPISITPAFIIQGMSLGFGIHRDFIPPKLDAILDFPLIQMSITPPPPLDLVELVDSLHDYFPAKTDQFFIVAGLKFRAFGLVDSLIMLAVKFGHDLELHVLGVSSVFLGGVFIELGWKAHFLPEKGEFFVGGQLTDRSFILVPSAQLTGGFAVQIWAKGQHEGDFVVSVGGYHPQYKVPAHYPQHIKRLGVSFEMGSVLTIKGGLYFAVTPEAIMMGGRLEAALYWSPVEGHLSISLDALIYYQPFRYDVMIAVDAEIKAEIDVKLTTVSIHKHLHLDVHVWGPDFSGKAYLDVGPKTFTVSFGSATDQKILPVAYADFKKKFLPNVLSASVTRGVLGKGKEGDQEIFIVNAKELEIAVNSVIPLTKQEGLVEEKNKLIDIYQPGVTPMGLQGGGYSANFTGLTPTGDNKPGEHDQFQYIPVSTKVAAAIWGDKGLKQVGEKLKANALTAYTIKPKKAQEAEETHEIDKQELAWNTDVFDLRERARDLQYTISEDATSDSDTLISNALDEKLMQAFTGLTTTDSFKKTDFLYEPIPADI